MATPVPVTSTLEEQRMLQVDKVVSTCSSTVTPAEKTKESSVHHPAGVDVKALFDLTEFDNLLDGVSLDGDEDEYYDSDASRSLSRSHSGSYSASYTDSDLSQDLHAV